MGFIQRVSDELSVALHVRRGDLVDDPYYSKSVGTLGLSYYETALERLRSRLPDARVYVFSDDPTWCARHLPKVLPTEIVSGQVTLSPVEDFVAMKACRHFVIANSTFSWWTAWLGTHPDKQIISPTAFSGNPALGRLTCCRIAGKKWNPVSDLRIMLTNHCLDEANCRATTLIAGRKLCGNESRRLTTKTTLVCK